MVANGNHCRTIVNSGCTAHVKSRLLGNARVEHYCFYTPCITRKNLSSCNTLGREFLLHVIHATPRFLSPCITPLLPFLLSHVLHGISTISSFMRFFLTLSGINSSHPSIRSERTVIRVK
nr:hypothetical protein [Scytonema sp. UIC 10036]